MPFRRKGADRDCVRCRAPQEIFESLTPGTKEAIANRIEKMRRESGNPDWPFPRRA